MPKTWFFSNKFWSNPTKTKLLCDKRPHMLFHKLKKFSTTSFFCVKVKLWNLDALCMQNDVANLCEKKKKKKVKKKRSEETEFGFLAQYIY